MFDNDCSDALQETHQCLDELAGFLLRVGKSKNKVDEQLMSYVARRLDKLSYELKGLKPSNEFSATLH